jgi:hypothetical protein
MKIGILATDFIIWDGGMDFMRPIVDSLSAPIRPRKGQVVTSLILGKTQLPTPVVSRIFAGLPRLAPFPGHWD